MKIGREIWDNPQARDEYVDTMLWEQEIFRRKFYHLEYDKLPWHIRLGMETHPRKGVKITEQTLSTEKWFCSDGTVEDIVRMPSFQLMEIEGFKKGDKVKVTVEKIHSYTESTRKER